METGTSQLKQPKQQQLEKSESLKDRHLVPASHSSQGERIEDLAGALDSPRSHNPPVSSSSSINGHIEAIEEAETSPEKSEPPVDSFFDDQLPSSSDEDERVLKWSSLPDSHHGLSKRSLDMLSSSSEFSGINQNFLQPLRPRAEANIDRDKHMLYNRLVDVLRRLKQTLESNRDKKSIETSSETTEKDSLDQTNDFPKFLYFGSDNNDDAENLDGDDDDSGEIKDTEDGDKTEKQTVDFPEIENLPRNDPMVNKRQKEFSELQKRFDLLSDSRFSGFNQNYLKKRDLTIPLQSAMNGMDQNFLKKRLDPLTSSALSGFNQNYLKKKFDPLSSGAMTFSQNHLKKRFMLSGGPMSGMEQNHVKRFDYLSSDNGLSDFNQNYLRKRFGHFTNSGLSGFNQNHIRKRFNHLSNSGLSGFNQNYIKKRFDSLSSSGLSGFDQNHLKKRFDFLSNGGLSGFNQNHIKKRFDSLSNSGLSGFNQNFLKKRFDALSTGGLSGFNQNFLKKRFDSLANSGISGFYQNHLKKRFNSLSSSGLSGFNQNHLRKRLDSLSNSGMSGFNQNYLKKRFDTLSTGGLSGFNQNFMKKRFDLPLDNQGDSLGQKYENDLDSTSKRIDPLVTARRFSGMYQNHLKKRDADNFPDLNSKPFYGTSSAPENRVVSDDSSHQPNKELLKADNAGKPETNHVMDNDKTSLTKLQPQTGSEGIFEQRRGENQGLRMKAAVENYKGDESSMGFSASVDNSKKDRTATGNSPLPVR